jgi:hypothetical protein
MPDVSHLTDEELRSLAEQVAREQDQRKPLDPEPWTWRNDARAPRRAWGPQNDGPPQPNGRLSELIPRAQYRQDPSAYAHTARVPLDNETMGDQIDHGGWEDH